MMKIIVSMPFQLTACHICFMTDHCKHGGDSSGDRHFFIRQTVAHGIAQTEFDIDSGRFSHFIQLIDHGDHKAFNIGAGNIFQMAAGNDSLFQSSRNNILIRIQRLTSVFSEFQENMIVGTGCKNTCFFKLHCFYQFKIFADSPDPCGDFRKTESEFLTCLHSFPVIFAVKKEFALTDQTAFSAETVHQFI